MLEWEKVFITSWLDKSTQFSRWKRLRFRRFPLKTISLKLENFEITWWSQAISLKKKLWRIGRLCWVPWKCIQVQNSAPKVVWHSLNSNYLLRTYMSKKFPHTTSAWTFMQSAKTHFPKEKPQWTKTGVKNKQLGQKLHTVHVKSKQFCVQQTFKHFDPVPLWKTDPIMMAISDEKKNRWKSKQNIKRKCETKLSYYAMKVSAETGKLWGKITKWSTLREGNSKWT